MNELEFLRGSGSVVAATKAYAIAHGGLTHLDVSALCARCAGPGRGSGYVLDDSPAPLYVRGVRHGGLLAPLWRGRVLHPRRALRELALNEQLHTQGAPVARPAFVAAHRAGASWPAALGWEVVLATRFEADAIDLATWLAQPRTAAERQKTLAAAARSIKALHDLGLRHPDLHAGNILVRGVCDAQPEPVALVIDLDRASLGARLGAARRTHELARLYRGLVKRRLHTRVGARETAAFVSAYCGNDRELRRALARAWPAERRRIRLHALAYRANS